MRESQGHVRPMLPGDLANVASIERHSYEFPWSRGVFRDCLLAGYQCLVIDSSDGVGGYGILSIAGGEAHILNLCVNRRFRGFGFGSQLLDELLARARAANVERVLLEVRPSNTVAIALYRKRGFLPVGSRRAYYQAPSGREDALVFALPLKTDTSRGR